MFFIRSIGHQVVKGGFPPLPNEPKHIGPLRSQRSFTPLPFIGVFRSSLRHRSIHKTPGILIRSDLGLNDFQTATEPYPLVPFG